jgi:hypothetical protein
MEVAGAALYIGTVACVCVHVSVCHALSETGVRSRHCASGVASSCCGVPTAGVW